MLGTRLGWESRALTRSVNEELDDSVFMGYLDTSGETLVI